MILNAFLLGKMQDLIAHDQLSLALCKNTNITSQNRSLQHTNEIIRVTLHEQHSRKKIIETNLEYIESVTKIVGIWKIINI